MSFAAGAVFHVCSAGDVDPKLDGETRDGADSGQRKISFFYIRLEKALFGDELKKRKITTLQVGSRLIRIWFVHIPRKFEVVQKWHCYLQNANLLSSFKTLSI